MLVSCSKKKGCVRTLKEIRSGDTYKSNAHLKQNQAPAKETQHKIYNYHVPKGIVQLQSKPVQDKTRQDKTRQGEK